MFAIFVVIDQQKEIPKIRKYLRLRRPLITLLLIKIVMVVVSLTTQVRKAKFYFYKGRKAFIGRKIRKVNPPILQLLKSMPLWFRKIRSKVIGKWSK